MKCPECGSKVGILVIGRADKSQLLSEAFGEIQIQEETIDNYVIIEVQCMNCDRIVGGDKQAREAFGLEEHEAPAKVKKE